MKLTRQQIEDRILEDWGESAEAGLCIDVLNLMLNLKPYLNSSSAKIKFSDIYDKVCNPVEHSYLSLLKLLPYLTGDIVNILKPVYEFRNNISKFPVSKDMLREAEQRGYLTHPETGVIFEDYKGHVTMDFTLGDDLR